jgi:hypothetical protein
MSEGFVLGPFDRWLPNKAIFKERVGDKLDLDFPGEGAALAKKYAGIVRTGWAASNSITGVAHTIEQIELAKRGRSSKRKEKEERRVARTLFEAKESLATVGTKRSALKHLFDAWKAHHLGVESDVAKAMGRAHHAGATEAEIHRVMDRAAKETSGVRERQYRAREKVARHERGENPKVYLVYHSVTVGVPSRLVSSFKSKKDAEGALREHNRTASMGGFYNVHPERSVKLWRARGESWDEPSGGVSPSWALAYPSHERESPDARRHESGGNPRVSRSVRDMTLKARVDALVGRSKK